MTPLFIAALALLLSTQEPPPASESGGVLCRFSPSIAPEQRTTILVLGTPHLDSVRGFERGMLTGLLDALEEWGPDAICVEALPGRTIATMRAEEATFRPVLNQFASVALQHGPAAQQYTGASRLEAETILRAGEEELGGFERAFLALAALDMPSALLYAAGARALGSEPPDDAPAALLRYLETGMSSHNEIASLAVPLALRLGLERLDAVDDHLDKDEFLRLADGLMAELADSGELAAASAAEVYADSAADLARSLAQGDLLAHYLHMNSAAFGLADVRAQWDVFLRTRLASGRDRARLALWDVRNLAIASHVRRVSARVPGRRVLVLIGAGHKPFLEALLETGLDVRTVSLAEVVSGARKVRTGR